MSRDQIVFTKSRALQIRGNMTLGERVCTYIVIHIYASGQNGIGNDRGTLLFGLSCATGNLLYFVACNWITKRMRLIRARVMFKGNALLRAYGCDLKNFIKMNLRLKCVRVNLKH